MAVMLQELSRLAESALARSFRCARKHCICLDISYPDFPVEEGFALPDFANLTVVSGSLSAWVGCARSGLKAGPCSELLHE